MEAVRERRGDRLVACLIVVIGLILFVPFIGKVHLFDWDEINFAEAAREMITTGDYLRVRIDYEPFHEKPPLFFWFQAASMKVFGVSEFAARLPNAIVGIATLLFLFYAGRKLYDRNFGLLWALTYIGSFLPHFYFKSGLIDPTFNLFMFLAVYFLYRYHDSGTDRFIIYAGIADALAVMTKGPVGFLLVFLAWAAFWAARRKKIKLPLRELIIFALIAFLPYVVWYGAVLYGSGSGIFAEFMKYQVRLLTTGDAGHGGPIYYHLVVLLLGCFPASVFMLRGLRKSADDDNAREDYRLWNVILLCVVVVIFSVVKTKIIHYSSLAYFPITFLAARAVYKIIYFNLPWKQSTSWLAGVIGTMMAVLLAGFPIVMMNIDMVLPRVTDMFTRELLRTDVAWAGYEPYIGVVWLAGVIFSLVCFKKRDLLKGVLAIYASTVFVMLTFLPIIAPKIEPYTQGAPIEFYEKMRGRDAYLEVLGFKSYAHYFYSRRPYGLSSFKSGLPKEAFKDSLLVGRIDKPAYFVVKNKKVLKYLALPGMHELYRKGGFVFLERLPGN